MRNLISLKKCSILAFVILLILHECSCFFEFTCPNREGEPVPDLPAAYSTIIRLNYIKQKKSVDIRKFVNEDGNKLLMDFDFDGRYVRYIRNGNQLLFIHFTKDGGPTCTVSTLTNTVDFLEEEDAGPSRILEKVAEVLYGPNKDKLVISDVSTETGAFVKKWEGCFDKPQINISMSFTELDWKQGLTSALHKGRYPVSIEAQIKDNFVVALFSFFDPIMPEDTVFQPPEDVYCPGFRPEKKIPSMTNFFSYDSELIVFESSAGIAPVASHRKMYYDFPNGIARTDFYDALSEDQDLFSPVTARGVSIIHDFNSGIQYKIDPLTGACTLDSFKATIGPINIRETGESTMLNGLEFFSLNSRKISYNGQFSTRGFTADVFSAPVEILNGEKKEKYIYSWYFSTGRTQIVEKEEVEKNVLLRMVIRPEAADGKEGEVDVNFYNFVKEQPSASKFDLTSCYNDSFSKAFVLTFPANELLRGYEKVLRKYVHQAVQSATGVSKQRIIVNEIAYSGKYIYAEFKLLASPDALGKGMASSNESTLDQAIAKLKAVASDNKLEVSVPTKDDKLITLRLEPDGLNEFAGDRKQQPEGHTYKEGPVIGLTIGMLFLGFVLGGVTLNLVVSRKFGVSLFQTQMKRDPFNSSLRDSSI